MDKPPNDPANLLGAVAVAAMDGIVAACRAVLDQGGETPAALVATGHAPGLSIDALGRVLGLSHPGTVRVVDRLAAVGLIERRPATDRRAVALHLTTNGVATRDALLAERQAALQRLLAPLQRSERALLGQLLAKLLQGLPRDPLHGLSICRLCDERRCEICPIDAGIAARDRRGHVPDEPPA